jgi:hypothetical protein
MKHRIIEALAYPRTLVRNHIDPSECSHSGHFNATDDECQDCYHNAECEWLHSNDEFVALQGKSIEELEGALEFAIGFVDALVTRRGHHTRTCRCEACVWLRDTEQLFNDLLNGSWQPMEASARTFP